MLKKLVIGALSCALVLSFGVAGEALAKKSKAEKRAEFVKKVTEKYKTKKKGALFVDLSYWVDLASLKDSRWKVPEKLPFKDVSAKGGIQCYATWSTGAPSAPMAIRIYVIKMRHKETKAGRSSTFSNTFEYIGESVKVADAKKLHEGYYRDWIKGATDVIKKQCTKPKKKGIGPAKFYAAAVGTGPKAKERQRREWYVWTDGQGEGNTWLARIIYDKSVLTKDAILKKGQEFMKVVKEIKEKP